MHNFEIVQHILQFAQTDKNRMQQSYYPSITCKQFTYKGWLKIKYTKGKINVTRQIQVHFQI